MTHNQHIYTQLLDPSCPPFPADLSSAQGMRASSNPELGQPQSQGGPLRHLPSIRCQIAAPQDRFPLQKLTPSTEVLEHVCPGSTSRGDFHSDPTAYNAMNTKNFGPPNASVAIPSRGLPGPFSYQSLPPSTQPAPLLNRLGTFDRKLPKGKKNPRKKSSDDARILSSPGNSPHLALRGASHKRTFTPENTQLSFHPRSTDTISSAQEERSFSGAVQFSDNYHYPRMPPYHHSTSVQEQSHCSSVHEQVPMHPAMEPHLHEHAGSNPFSPSATELHGSIYDPRTTVPGLTTPTNVQHQDTTANQQLFEGNADLAATQVPPHSTQPLYPHVFGRQLPGRQSDVQHQQEHSSNFERSALATMSNSSQAHRLVTLGQSIAKESPRRLVWGGCKIWIGGLPNGLDKAGVRDLLRPCRGLIDTSNPRISSPSKYRTSSSYVFAKYVIPISYIARNANPKVTASRILMMLPKRWNVYLRCGSHGCPTDASSVRVTQDIGNSHLRATNSMRAMKARSGLFPIFRQSSHAMAKTLLMRENPKMNMAANHRKARLEGKNPQLVLWREDCESSLNVSVWWNRIRGNQRFSLKTQQ